MSRTIEVSLPDDLVERVDERVRQQGTDRDRTIQELIEKGLQGRDTGIGPTIADLLARAASPSQAQPEADEEMALFAEAEVRAHRAEKRRATSRG